MKFHDLVGGKVDKMPFGKYKDTPIHKVPDDYLVWLHDNGRMDYALQEAVEEVMLERFKKMVTVEKAKAEEENAIDAAYWAGEIY